MKLSACYIVKDEEQDFEKSLQSIKDLVDEVIVIDTGGTTAIQRITAKHNGRYFPYEWKYDFAAARNFALNQVMGEWVIFLDADEYIVSGKNLNLHRSIEKLQDGADVFLIKLVNIDEDNSGKMIDYFFAPRIFRAARGIKYSGKIHEQLLKQGKPIADVKVIPEEELIVCHTGYSARKLLMKAQRNLPLLLDELNNSLNAEDLYIYLAEAYDGIGDWENALKYAYLDIGLGRRNITFASRSYRLCLRILEQKIIPDADEIRRIAKEASQIFSEVPDFHAEYAQWLAEKFAYDEAIFEMKQAINCSKAKPGSLLEPTLFDAQAYDTAEKLIEDWEKIKINHRKIKISACVIVKNEEAEIGRWIDNMKFCTDEQIVVDTGSVDNTVKIASAAGVKVFSFAWNDDFSAAKNFAVEQATGDWIVFLDADEFFSLDSIDNVRNVISREDIKGNEVDAIFCPIINIDVDKNNVELSRFMNLRIFRNVPYLRYYGNIHEGIRHKNSELRIFIEKKFLHIYHTGYSSNRIEKKLQRNLALLQQDIAENGEGLQHYRYLMDCYQGLGDHEKAIKYAKLHLDSDASSVGSESDIYRTLINSMVFVETDSDEIRKYIQAAIERFPDMPDFYAYYAADYFRNQEFTKAKECLLKALALYSVKGTASVEASSFSYILSEVYSYLAEIYWQEGNEKKFTEYIRLAIQDNRYNCQAFAQLWRLLEKENVETKITILDEYYEPNKKDIGFLVEVLEKYFMDEVYFHYAKQLEKIAGIFNETVLLYRLLKDGDMNELYQQSLQQIIGKVQLLAYAALKMKALPESDIIKNMLPSGIWNWICAYHGRQLRPDSRDYDAYLAILPFVMRMGNKEMQAKFLSLADQGDLKQKIEICHILEKESCWEEMANILLPLASRDIETVDLLGKIGEALFYCAQYNKSEDYFKQAAEKGDISRKTAMFLSWIEEKKMKGLA